MIIMIMILNQAPSSEEKLGHKRGFRFCLNLELINLANANMSKDAFFKH